MKEIEIHIQELRTSIQLQADVVAKCIQQEMDTIVARHKEACVKELDELTARVIATQRPEMGVVKVIIRTPEISSPEQTKTKNT